jgi:class 3 adenylate cyclase
VPLRPKVFQVLAYLLAQCHRVVPKDELLAHAWPGQCLSDETLSTCITAARQAVGDSGQRQDLIQTRRGVGYRFVAAVDVDHAGVDADAETPGGVPAAPVSLLPAAVAVPAPEAFPASALPSAAVMPPLAGEAKPVTVLAGRLHNAVALAERLEPEALHHTLQMVFALVIEAVQRYGGTLQHLLDDGFLALFGAPVAQEDHARRAVLAAMDLQQRLGDGNPSAGLSHGLSPGLCLGLHTGRVLVGPVGTDGPPTYTAVGNTARLATRLAQQASPGAILLSAPTRQLLR